MLLGTIFGIFIIPGLYYIFAKWDDKHHLLPEEKHEVRHHVHKPEIHFPDKPFDNFKDEK
jgi:hypothetical protein